MISLVPLLMIVTVSMAYTIPPVGSDAASIEAQLGEPIGTIALRDKVIYLYPQGEITLKEGRAVDVDLMTLTEFEADQKRLEAERQEWEAEQAALSTERQALGEAVKADKLSSVRFNGLPPDERAQYWRNFQKTYPEVDVSEELESALETYRAELAELRKERQLAEMQARVAQAEKEAEAARQESQRLKNQLDARTRYYGLRSYTDPVVDRRYYYRPPTIVIHAGNSETQGHKGKPAEPASNQEDPRRVRVWGIQD